LLLEKYDIKAAGLFPPLFFDSDRPDDKAMGKSCSKCGFALHIGPLRAEAGNSSRLIGVPSLQSPAFRSDNR